MEDNGWWSEGLSVEDCILNIVSDRVFEGLFFILIEVYVVGLFIWC